MTHWFTTTWKHRPLLAYSAQLKGVSVFSMIAPFGETVQRDDESCPWGKLLQLSEKAEDSRRPKKCLAKQSAAAQRKRCCKRCRAASLADASPRLARGRSENIWIRLTRQRRDLTDNARKWKEIKELQRGGDWGWGWEKACTAGGILLSEARTKRMFLIHCQNSLVTKDRETSWQPIAHFALWLYRSRIFHWHLNMFCTSKVSRGDPTFNDQFSSFVLTAKSQK